MAGPQADFEAHLDTILDALEESGQHEHASHLTSRMDVCQTCDYRRGDWCDLVECSPINYGLRRWKKCSRWQD